MESIKLSSLFELPHFSDSPIHRFSLRVCPNKNSYFPVFSSTQFPTQILPHNNRIQPIFCVNEPKDLSLDRPPTSSGTTVQCHNKSEDCIPSDDRLIRNAAWIGGATIICKILGLIREVTIAAIFGIGPVATAFKYASVLPGFSSALLGGVNGPIHITMATTLSKLAMERRRQLFQHINAVMFLVGGVVGAIVYVSAEFIIQIYAPGGIIFKSFEPYDRVSEWAYGWSLFFIELQLSLILLMRKSPFGLWILEEGQTLRKIAIAQICGVEATMHVIMLKIMIPCIVFGGPVGLGFGCMSAEGNNILPSISPALSSMLMIAFSFLYALMRRLNAFQPDEELSGGIFLSFGALLGIFLQWIVQVIVLRRGWDNTVPVSWMTILKDRDVFQFFSLLLPATISLGLAHIASFTDLYFASLIPGAAAALSYAYLLVMAPLGILSSIVILPLLPSFSKLAKSLSWPSLVDSLKRAILLSTVVILPIMSIMCVLAAPITRFLFERHAFDSAASALVSSLFFFYSLGSPFYIVRELLVTVFYALEDGQLPFLVSMGTITLNAILDWLFVSRFYLGAQGLALSTSFTTALSVLILFHLLQKKLAGIVDYAEFTSPILLLFSCSIICGLTTSITYKMLDSLLSSIFIARLPRIQELLSICLAGSMGMIGFFFPLILLHILGFKLVRTLFRTLTNR